MAVKTSPQTTEPADFTLPTPPVMALPALKKLKDNIL
jgi:hypothetical protein